MRLRFVFAYIWLAQRLRARAGALLGALTVFTILGGVAAFHAEAAQRGDTMSVAEALYSTLGLFAFAGNRFGFPQTWPLILVYFLAPYITASALIEAALRVLQERNSLLLTGMRDHTVVCGAGNLGLLVAGVYEKHRVPTVLVNDQAPDAAEDAAALVVLGDMTRDATLRSARAESAGRVYVTTGNDLVNLEVATRLAGTLGDRKGPQIFCHIGDGGLRESLLDTGGPGRVNYFNSYRLSAKALLAGMFADGWLPALRVGSGTLLRAHEGAFQLTAAADEVSPRVVVVVGLGRFGLAVAEQLADLLPDEAELWVVDSREGAIDAARPRLERKRAVRSWCADVADTAWCQEAAAHGRRAMVFLCTDQDRDNLRVAMGLGRSVRTVVRMFDQSFGDRFKDFSLDRRDIKPAGFRALFADAHPMLAYQHDVQGPEGQVPRIRTCLRLPGHTERWYLTWLSPDEQASAKAQAGALCVADLPRDGQVADVPRGWWLLRSAVFEQLAPRR